MVQIAVAEADACPVSTPAIPMVTFAEGICRISKQLLSVAGSCRDHGAQYMWLLRTARCEALDVQSALPQYHVHANVMQFGMCMIQTCRICGEFKHVSAASQCLVWPLRPMASFYAMCGQVSAQT